MFIDQARNEKPKKAVLYARYSPRPGSRFGAPMRDLGPCQMQLDICRRWCNGSKIDVLDEYRDEAKSGGRMDNRKGLEAALDLVCRKRGILVVFSLSRLARSTKDAIHIFERLRKAKADLVSLSETIDTTTAMGRFVFTLMAGIATLEREVTAERTRVSMLRHQANGRRMSDCCPY